MKSLEEICFYLTRSRNNILVILKTNVFGVDGGMAMASIRFVSHFQHVAIVFCRDPPTFVLERLLSLVKRALIANSVFFKTLSKSIYTSNMIKGGGQGGLKCKKY